MPAQAVSYPACKDLSRSRLRSNTANLRNSPEKIVRRSEEKIAAHYTGRLARRMGTAWLFWRSAIRAACGAVGSASCDLRRRAPQIRDAPPRPKEVAAQGASAPAGPAARRLPFGENINLCSMRRLNAPVKWGDASYGGIPTRLLNPKHLVTIYTHVAAVVEIAVARVRLN